MAPKHNNPRYPRQDRFGNEIWARAPYNFVPLPETIVTVDSVPSLDRYTGLTGNIRCRLTTKSPLYVRACMTPEFFKKWGQKAFHELPEAEQEEAARFFAINAPEPLIPASSLRGMVRNLVEIAAYAKLRWVTDEPLVFRAVGDTTSLGEYYRSRLMQDDGNKHYTPLMRAGYLRRDGQQWQIVPAQTIGGTTFARIWQNDIRNIRGPLPRWPDDARPCANAHRIWVRLGVYDYQDVRRGFLKVKYTPVLAAAGEAQAGYQEGVLAYSGPMNKKAHEAVIYPPDNAANPIPVDDDLIRRYRDQISQEQQKLLGDHAALNPDQPVFYLLDKNGKLAFFGHLWLFRLPYEHSPLDLVPRTLRDVTTVDMAEAVFGFVAESNQDKRQSRAGRVTFTDARLVAGQGDVWAAVNSITPRILAGPKPTTFQHYLTQQEPDEAETGKFDRQGQPKTERRLDHYASPPPHQTTIRGHKLYWHKGAVALIDIEERDQNKIRTAPKQYTRVRPVKTNISFEFNIAFENLRPEELGALLWVLMLPGEPERTYCHKIGMGKPLGMGSVAITTELSLRDRTKPPSNQPDEEGRYARLVTDGHWQLGQEDSGALADAIAAFEQYVLTQIAPTERRGASTLKDVKRIQMLLALLEWHENTPDWQETTRYMEIEHGPRKLNEYKERPVLPDPLAVVAGQPVQPPAPARQATGQVPPRPLPASGVTTNRPPQSTPPASTTPAPQLRSSVSPASKPQPIREATVVKADASFVTVELDGKQINIPLNELAEPGRDERERQRRYPAGSKIKVRDLGLSSKGKRRLTTKL